MADHHTYEYRTTEDRRAGSSGALAFIVGGLVVIVAVLAYVIFGEGFDFGSTAPASEIEINTSADSAAGAEAADDGAEAAAASETDDAGATAGATATASD